VSDLSDALPGDLAADLVALAEGPSAAAHGASAFGRPPLGRPLDDDVFDHLARRVFEHQWRTNPTYRAFCEGRGASPETWAGWQAVPAVPTRGFRDIDLVSGDPDRVERTFRTSGTTSDPDPASVAAVGRGPGRRTRGAHHVLSMDLYRRLSLPWFRANLLPDLERTDRLRVISLIPDPLAVPDSSLSAMVGFVMDAHGDGGSGYVAHPGTAVDAEALVIALERAARDGGPTLMLGTAFAFVHMIDALAERDVSVTLPPGSRAMETGGFKGRSREVPRDELYAGIEERAGIPEDQIVNEYGMTELLSQFYEPILRDQARVPGAARVVEVRRHRPPPWMRTRIVSPDTLKPVQPGTVGLLQHFDLANVGSVSAVLTEDLGTTVQDGFVVLGRTPGSEPRGCSLAMEELLSPAGIIEERSDEKEGRGP
jgi:acyl-CoA synthetase (AMP-forming)/AMP-acid ligase II